MTRTPSPILLIGLFSVILICCQANKPTIKKEGWGSRNLSDFWTIQLPPNTSINGCGCTNDLKSPGVITFDNDSIQIEFYVNKPVDSEPKCDFDAAVRWVKENNGPGACQGDGPPFEVSIQINNSAKMAGAIGKAIDSTTYISTLELLHCTNHSITLISNSRSSYYDAIASEIFKSVEFKKPNQ